MATPASNGQTTVGIGGTTSGQEGATRTHETQQETGGSGGAQLTHSTGEVDGAPESAPASAPEPAPEAQGSAVQTGARGHLDTTSEQAGGTGTGIGSRESGANQSQDDLPPQP